MGVSVHYWAIPPSSALFRRLQRDKAFAVLMAFLFPYGRGIFHFFDDKGIEEREEILDEVIDRHGEVLGPEPEARRRIDEFRLELDRTRSAYAGVERRRCSLEKTSRLVEERLLRELKRLRGEGAEGFLRGLMFGDQALSRNLGLSGEDVLGLVSPPLVREAAQVLDGLDAEALFARDGGWEEYHLNDFQRWRQLYRNAAAGGEALLVGVC
jgi:hypothetical protein